MFGSVAVMFSSSALTRRTLPPSLCHCCFWFLDLCQGLCDMCKISHYHTARDQSCKITRVIYPQVTVESLVKLHAWATVCRETIAVLCTVAPNVEPYGIVSSRPPHRRYVVTQFHLTLLTSMLLPHVYIIVPGQFLTWYFLQTQKTNYWPQF